MSDHRGGGGVKDGARDAKEGVGEHEMYIAVGDCFVRKAAQSLEHPFPIA